MGNAAKELGGKALKDIYTTPITNQAGEVVGSKVDKTGSYCNIKYYSYLS
jgi:hypothetical protein